MEIKEYIQILKKNSKIFFGTIFGMLLIGINFYFLLPDNYRTYLNVDVTRSGKKVGVVYGDDEFYRLQADERFADTVVRWIGSLRFQSDIKRDSEIESNLKLKAKRLSSQMIEVTYVTDSIDQSQRVANSISDIINKRAKELNKDQKISNWFKVVSAEPYVQKNKINFWKIISIFLSLGIFLGFWVVFVFHYFKKQK